MTQEQTNVMRLFRELTLIEDDGSMQVTEPEFDGDVVTVVAVDENKFLDVGCRLTVSAEGNVLCIDPDGQEATVEYLKVPTTFIGYALSEGIEAAEDFTLKVEPEQVGELISSLLGAIAGLAGGSDEDTNCGDPECPRHGYLNREDDRPKSMEELKKRLGSGQLPFRVSMN
jgi:hypothetical protein